jgi:Family of unknown function (DUF5681)
MGKPFVKGQSGNPSGRPKGIVSLQTLARTFDAEMFQIVVKVARTAPQPAIRLQAALAVLERGHGKPMQNVTTRVIRSIADLTDEELAALLASEEAAERESMH